MIYQHVFDMVGNTPSIRLRVPGPPNCQFFLKLEGCNPTGSIKDRPCLMMLRAALERGSLKPGRTLLDASSGNFACALAFFGHVLGYRASVAVSSKLTAAKRDFLEFFGAAIHSVGDFTIEGNRYCRQMAETHREQYFFLDQLHNWDNPRSHYETTGPEILNAFPDIAMCVGSLGSGGAMTGIARYLREFAPAVKIVAVECASGSRIPGTGTFVDGDYETPFIREAREKSYFDRVFCVTETDAADAVHQLVSEGIFCGLQTGGVLSAALNCAADWRTEGSVVILSGDTGWKNLDRLKALRAASREACGNTQEVVPCASTY